MNFANADPSPDPTVLDADAERIRGTAQGRPAAAGRLTQRFSETMPSWSLVTR